MSTLKRPSGRRAEDDTVGQDCPVPGYGQAPGLQPLRTNFGDSNVIKQPSRYPLIMYR